MKSRRSWREKQPKAQRDKNDTIWYLKEMKHLGTYIEQDRSKNLRRKCLNNYYGPIVKQQSPNLCHKSTVSRRHREENR